VRLTISGQKRRLGWSIFVETHCQLANAPRSDPGHLASHGKSSDLINIIIPEFWTFKKGVKHMDVDQCSTGGLRSLHDGVRAALAEDDALPKGKKEFGVRENQRALSQKASSSVSSGASAGVARTSPLAFIAAISLRE
jgi:hypothetical protein